MALINLTVFLEQRPPISKMSQGNYAGADLNGAVFGYRSYKAATLMLASLVGATYLSYLLYGNWFGDVVGVVNAVVSTSFVSLVNSAYRTPRAAITASLCAALDILMLAALAHLYTVYTGHKLDVEFTSFIYPAFSGYLVYSANLIFKWYDWYTVRECNFQKSILKGSEWLKVKLVSCSLLEADLSNAKFNGSAVTGCNFDDCNLSNIVSKESAFLNCSFDDSLATKANFSSSILTSCTFEHCDLTGADFSKTKLTGLSFAGANLCNAKLQPIFMTNCNLTGARANKATKWPNGFDAEGAGVIFDDGLDTERYQARAPLGAV